MFNFRRTVRILTGFVFYTASVIGTTVLARDYPALLGQSFEDVEALFELGDLTPDEYDTLQALHRDPADLNQATIQQLMELPFVDYSVAKAIVKARQTSNGFIHKSQLLDVPGIGRAELAILRLFVTTGKAKRIRAISQRWSFDNLSAQAYRDNDRQHASNLRGLQSLMGWESHWRDQFHLHALLTRRERADAFYDEATGFLTSRGRENQFDLERLSLFSRQKLQWILGHYNTGFGQRLTFDMSGLQNPDGWRLRPAAVYRYGQGDIRTTPALFGGAIDKTFALGASQWQGSVFFSSQDRDLYQYDFGYGPDAWSQPLLGDCTTPGRSQGPFVCAANGRWYTSRLIDEKGETIGFTTLNNVFHESIVGEHMQWLGEKHRIGLVHYDATFDFNLPLPDIRFSPQARFPNKAAVAAFGMYYRYNGSYQFVSEISTTGGGGRGYYAGWEKKTGRRSRLRISLRHYNQHFENPYSAGEAARGQTLGLSQRNEQGFRIHFESRIGSLRSTTQMDIWQRPYSLLDTGYWERDGSAKPDAQLQQRLTMPFDANNQLAILYDWINKDISDNGRRESYSNGDDFGRGEKRNSKLQWLHQFDRGYTTLSYAYSWQDVAKYHDKFDHEQQWTAAYQLPLASKSSLRMYAAYWIHPVPYTGVNFHDREKPAFNTYVQWHQQLSGTMQWRVRLGFIRYRDDRPDRFDRYFTVFVGMTYHF